jgi:trans-aconitate 2-methyltransferase
VKADAWDPGRYGRFAAERSQPFFDLVGLLRPVPGGRVVDLGCGPGTLTVQLPGMLDAAEVLGLDNSPAMLDAAAEIGDGSGSIRFAEGEIGSWSEPGAWDVVLANASLQWVADHPAVLARWAESLRTGGQLAVQVPANADHPSHRLAAEVATEEPFASAFPDGPPPDVVAANVLAPEAYAVVLHELGLGDQHVRLQVYGHELESTAAVVDWVRGTSLTRFERVLPAELFARYVERYRDRLVDALGDRSPYFYPFKRILFRASRR